MLLLNLLALVVCTIVLAAPAIPPTSLSSTQAAAVASQSSQPKLYKGSCTAIAHSAPPTAPTPLSNSTHGTPSTPTLAHSPSSVPSSHASVTGIPIPSNASTAIPKPSSTGAAPPTAPPVPPVGAGAQWTAPSQMSSLAAFNVTGFASGQQNLQIVGQVPSSATGSSTTSSYNSPDAILQIVYPAGSIDPANQPVGGADFYASPINLAGAQNVSLEYSVLFPVGFNWVLGGKLPGLYGGHTGCSGGSAATDCFSTRLMWRQQGAGELYLYAPKNKQTAALCADPQSVCNTAYGFSIGRGSFNYTPGEWVTLQQNIVLNTPGQTDGVFTLFVNGQPVIHRSDIFYRDVFPTPVEFNGLFFSTFFGGHTAQYATPTEQYSYFKDFAITRYD